MDTKQVADQLVTLCRENKNLDAISQLYSPNIVSKEAQAPEGMPAEMQGIDAIRGKNEWWVNNHQIHSAETQGPYVNGDRFAVVFDYDVTPTAGPMAGQRMQMKEVAVYTVDNGKIVHEEFLY